MSTMSIFRPWAVLAAAVAGLASAATAQAQTVVKPEFLLIVDTSGSMRAATGSANSCAYPDRRQNAAACVVRNIADGVGDAIFGMATYQANCNAARTPRYQTNGASDGYGCGTANCRYAYPATTPAAAAFPAYPFNFYGCDDGGVLWVQPRETNINLLRSWGDNSFTSCTAAPAVGAVGGPDLVYENPFWNPETNTRYTPLAGSLRTLSRYLTHQLAPAQPSPYRDFNGTGAVDLAHACRPMNIVLLTDGDECCDQFDLGLCDLSSTSMGAELNARNIGCLQVDLNGDGDTADNPIVGGPLDGHYEANIDSNRDGDCYDAGEQRAFKTHVYPIGFGLTCPNTQIEAIAQAGGAALHAVAGCGNRYGYYATNEASISAAINQIVSDSQLIEKCNGVDDTCDGVVDEGFNVGTACTVGVGACARTGALVCNATFDGTNCSATAGAAGTETSLAACSNGLDDDCDGLTDCADSGCSALSVCTGACTPLPEVCDGRDNDCDGMVDEGGITRPCGFALGVCTVGVETCTAQTAPGSGSPIWAGCTAVRPGTESCNNLDDDCNGVADDGISQPCGVDTGECRAGTRLCVGGVFGGACIGEITPTTEVCDGLDNDCNGVVDNGIASMGSCGAAGIGVCTGGTIQCMGGRLQCVGGTMPGTETCNGLDDDCNGLTDDGIATMACTATGTPMPVVGACRAGSTACRGGTTVCVGAVGPTAEVCNGQDDDCNGMTDDGVVTGVPCGAATGVCTTGVTACVAGRELCMGAMMSSPEVCDGVDNDCDGMTDEGNPGGGTPCGMSTGECVAGVTICMGGMLTCQGETGPTAEVCDGLDNDCDGTVDDGVPMGAPCGSTVGECTPGTTACVAGRPVCMGSRGPAPEECNCKDDDCDGNVDNVATGGSPLCGAGAVCAGAPHCACLKPCGTGEFQCPIGRTCDTVDGMELCVGDPCANVTCNAATEVCTNGTCRGRCDGVTCNPGLVCNPRDGTCVANDCRLLDNCTATQICRSGTCVANPCATVTCQAGQACYDGTCAPTCDGVACGPGQTCSRGVCVTAGPCAAVTCTPAQVCDPSTGTCTNNRCVNRACSTGQRCNGVTGTCEDDPCAVVTCPTGQTCSNGECATPIPPDQPPRQRVIAQGGPTCSVGRTPGRTPERGWALAGLGVCMAMALGRRGARRGRAQAQAEVQ